MMTAAPLASAAAAASPSPVPLPTATAASADVEMTDAAAAPTAETTPLEWTITDQLLLVSAAQRVCHSSPQSADPSPLLSLIDWVAVAQTMQTKIAGSRSAADNAFTPNACSERFANLLCASGVHPSLTAGAPVSSLPSLSRADLTPLLQSLLHNLVRQRIAQLEAEQVLAQAKQLKLDAGIAEATARLQAQREAQRTSAASAAAAAASAAAAAALTPTVPPTPVAVSHTGTISVKLESVSSSSRPPALMSPLAAASAEPTSTRPAPLVIGSPSMGALGGSQPAWPNSSLHTPLKTISQSVLSRQSSASSTAPLQSPPMSRQQSTTDGAATAAAPPFAPQTPVAPVTLSPEKIHDVFQMILSTLTSRPEADIFLVPVDPADAQGYYDVIKTPMSFQDVREKIASGEVTTPLQFWAVVSQIYINCFTYNDKKTTFFKQGRVLEGITADMFRKYFAMYSGPWETINKKGGQGRTPKYTPVTPAASTITQNFAAAAAAAAASPMASPTPATGASFAPIPLQLPGTPQSSPSPAPSLSVPGGATLPSTPSTPTRKSGPRSLSSSGGSDLPNIDETTAAATNELPRAAPRRTSVHSATGPPLSARKASRSTDADGDESMAEGDAEGEAESVGEDAIGSIHDALSTPARGATGRKRGAGTLATPNSAAAASPMSGATTAATPATARKAVRRTGAPPATPTGATIPASATGSTPTPTAAASDDAMDTDAADKGKRRGRPNKGK